jgi:hypothetical protein
LDFSGIKVFFKGLDLSGIKVFFKGLNLSGTQASVQEKIINNRSFKKTDPLRKQIL